RADDFSANEFTANGIRHGCTPPPVQRVSNPNPTRSPRILRHAREQLVSPASEPEHTPEKPQRFWPQPSEHGCALFIRNGNVFQRRVKSDCLDVGWPLRMLRPPRVLPLAPL